MKNLFLRKQKLIIILVIIFLIVIFFVFKNNIYHLIGLDNNFGKESLYNYHFYVVNYDFDSYIPATELSKSYPDGYCCCQYMYQGDITFEPGLFLFADCKAKNGQCIEYDMENCKNENQGYQSWHPCCHP